MSHVSWHEVCKLKCHSNIILLVDSSCHCKWIWKVISVMYSCTGRDRYGSQWMVQISTWENISEYIRTWGKCSVSNFWWILYRLTLTQILAIDNAWDSYIAE